MAKLVYAQVERTCKRCSNKFMGARRADYCSNVCKYPPKVCAMVGCVNMTTTNGSYCSVLCRNRHIAMKNRDTGRMKAAQNRPEVREKKSVSQREAFNNIDTQERHKNAVNESFENGRVIWNKKNVLGSIKKKCPYCNNEFETSTDRKYCSRSCLNKSTHTSNIPIDEDLIVKLKNEGKQDYEIVKEIGHSQERVREIINKLITEGKITRHKKTNRVKVNCSHCNGEFSVIPCKVKKEIFCSIECYYEFVRSKKPPISKKCPLCLKDYDTKRYDQVYCSDECKLKGINKGLLEANKEKYTTEKRTEVQLKRWAENKESILIQRQTPEYLAKIGETTRERFANDEEFKKKHSDSLRDAWAKKTPEETKIRIIKQHETKKANGSYMRSKEEDEVYSFITRKFPDAIRAHRDEIRYPYNCDFYIPSLDLFIEYQGYWTHGNRPYDGMNLPIEWLNKALESGLKTHTGALNVYIKTDPEKRRCARDNDLNFLEIWDYKDENDVLEQIDNYMKSILIKKQESIILS